MNKVDGAPATRGPVEALSDLLAPEAVAAAIAVPNKKALFQQLAGIAGRLVDVDPRLVVERLADRERLGSTGFGGGVAIPHGKIEGLNRVVGLFARLAQPIDFNAIDDLPVDLVFLLLSPPDAGVEHLKALARVSRRLRDRAFVAKLRGAGSQDALYALFASGEGRDAGEQGPRPAQP
ncbi:MAG: lactose transporter subunit [Sphingomonas bacterium]|nr:PTS sugar transporter subunit IIA [Sphingomonas bacterium]MDB5689484.1 lactose transporter subunit [Sphingomonas bacterium]